MTEFAVGDKVRYTGQSGSTNTEWIGMEGVVTEVFHRTVAMTITKPVRPNHPMFAEGFELYPSKDNLELITEFGFKDIREGDLIRRTILRSDGSKVIWEGVAHRKNYAGDKWLTEKDYHLYYKEDDEREVLSIELLERPEPKHWTEEKPVGSMFLYGSGENKAVWKKTTKFGWTRTFLTNNLSNFYTNSEVKRLITKDLEWLK